MDYDELLIPTWVHSLTITPLTSLRARSARIRSLRSSLPSNMASRSMPLSFRR
nr:MAG TPA: hypothetical protein [Caudoviricetes sp.]